MGHSASFHYWNANSCEFLAVLGIYIELAVVPGPGSEPSRV